jgi:small-conductance mechanosensitive channel/CRP-like cAMP-binding protein
MTLHQGAGYTILTFLLTAFLTWRLARGERRSVVTVVALFVVSVLCLALAGELREIGYLTAAEYLRGFAIFGEGLCILYLGALLIFQAIVPLTRLTPPRIVHDVVFSVAAVVWAVIWLRMNRVDLTSIVATSAVVTAVVAFSLQDTLGNILGGIAIQLDQSIAVGDWIQVDEVEGRVTEIRWRHTSLETRDWETIVVPNGHLVKNKFRVLGRRQGQPTQLRRTIYFNVDFRYSPADVIDAVDAAFTDHEIPRVSRSPRPHTLLFDIAASEAKYGVRYWINDLTQDDPIDSDVRQAIHNALKRAHIPLSIPAQAVFLTVEDEDRRHRKEDEESRRRLNALRRVDLFQHLQPEELETLAHGMGHEPFAANEIMTRQGTKADWLYLIIRGRADVLVEDEDGDTSKVSELGPGSFFGEMGLITGEPRTATVIARSEVDTYRLDKEAFEEVLRSRPAIAAEVSGILAARRIELEAARESLDAAARARRLRNTRNALLERIQLFFGLEEQTNGRK